ncbi:unnamed protein product [Prorocentrum cordatum]|uniref:Uncharacterized protein n=1 Tax=Prorocentrum cordatum TaxID=2364126 RepID=A0ABN9UAW4_9DINO|nr:unnamed protein product [Polarella glacialis]
MRASLIGALNDSWRPLRDKGHRVRLVRGVLHRHLEHMDGRIAAALPARRARLVVVQPPAERHGDAAGDLHLADTKVLDEAERGHTIVNDGPFCTILCKAATRNFDLSWVVMRILRISILATDSANRKRGLPDWQPEAKNGSDKCSVDDDPA